MTTTVQSLIGSTGLYSTAQAWEDACPADLTVTDQIWQGQLQNQVHSVAAGTFLTISGTTTDATRYKHLTTAAGASFKDNAGKLTNALRFNTANGAAITHANAYSRVIDIGDNYTRVTGIQMKATAGYELIRTAGLNGTYVLVDSCIIESGGPNPQFGPNTTIVNSVYVTVAGSGPFNMYSTTTAINCTFLFLTSSTTAITTVYGASNLKNCAIFGAAVLKSGNAPATYATCANDLASPPSGVTQIGFNTTTGAGFKNITIGTHDVRLNNTSALINAGASDSAALVDILGQTRSLTTPTIGAFEYVAAGGGPATYSYTASGGFVLSGTATKVRGRVKTASGGIQTGGAATINRGAARAGSGGMQLGGSASLAKGRAISASGGLTISGATSILRGVARSASGGFVLAGHATTTFFSAVQSLIVTPVGGIVIAGGAAVARGVRKAAAGGIAFAGHAATTFFPPSGPGALSSLLPEFIRRRRRR